MSGSRSKVDAVIQSAVAADSDRPTTAIRASSTCSRPASGPRSGANQRRQPPARRATSAAPDIARTSIAVAPAAIVSRPASPRKSERCRLVSQRCTGLGSADPRSAPVAGSTTADPGVPPANHQAVILPDGARRISSSPGWRAATRAARSATLCPATACGADIRSAAGKTDSAAPLSARTVRKARARSPGQR